MYLIVTMVKAHVYLFIFILKKSWLYKLYMANKIVDIADVYRIYDWFAQVY